MQLQDGGLQWVHNNIPTGWCVRGDRQLMPEYFVFRLNAIERLDGRRKRLAANQEILEPLSICSKQMHVAIVTPER